jgi:hypothetical protein
MNVQPGDAIMGHIHHRLLVTRRRQGRLANAKAKKQASERRRSLRKSRSSKRPRSNSQPSFKASLSDRPLASSPDIYHQTR